MNNDKAIINIDIWLLLFLLLFRRFKTFSLKEKSKKNTCFFYGNKIEKLTG